MLNLFVQPHPDDVPWSCGGTLRKLIDHEQPCLVVTVFDASPDPSRPLNELARALHRAWGLSDDPMQARLAENDAALARLGVAGERLGLMEGIYRVNGSDTPAKLMSPPPAEETELYRAVDAAIVECALRHQATRVFLPLAIGTQVDHVLCFHAIDALRTRGVAVYCYEDFPYVTRRPEALGARLASLDMRLVPALVDITAQLESRIAASLLYASQLPVLFRGADPGEAISAYVTQPDGRKVERFWTCDTRSIDPS